MPVSPSAQAFITVDDVKEYLGRKDTDPSQDAVLQRIVNGACKQIHSYTGREWVSTLNPNPGGKDFPLRPGFTGYGYVSFGRSQCQVGSITGVQIDTDTPTPTDVPSTQYSAQPINADWGVWTGLQLYTYASGNVLRTGAGIQRRVTVSARWGWASVPDDVIEAALITAATWLRRDVQTFSQQANLEEEHLQRPRAIPSQACDLLQEYLQVPVR